MRKATFDEDEIRVIFEEVALNVRCCSLPTLRQSDKHCKEWSTAANVNVCGVAKRFPEEVSDIWRALKEETLNYPDHLDTHSGKTTTGENTCSLPYLASVPRIFNSSVRQPVRLPIAMSLSMLSLMVTVAYGSLFESDVLEELFITDCIKRMS